MLLCLINWKRRQWENLEVKVMEPRVKEKTHLFEFLSMKEKKNPWGHVFFWSKVVSYNLCLVDPVLCQINACRDVNLSLYYSTFTSCKDCHFSGDPLHTLCFFRVNMTHTHLDLPWSDLSESAGALHTIKNLQTQGRRPRMMVYYLVPLPCDCISKPSTERRQGRANQGSVLLRCSGCSTNTKVMSDQRELPNTRGHKTSEQGFTICWQTCRGRECSARLSYTIPAAVACHSARNFGLKNCTANGGGAESNAVNGQTRMTGLNLHFILDILFSTNKLKPEKT